MRLKQLTKREFIQYLHNLPTNAEIGKSLVPTCCPISIFLMKNFRECVVYTYGRSLQTNINGKWKVYNLPMWARLFVLFVDSNSPKGTAITRELGLHVIDKINKIIRFPKSLESYHC